jgi:hypothetical protein
LRWYLVVLIFISRMTNDFEHFSIYLFFFFWEVFIQIISLLENWIHSFLWCFLNSLCILDTNPFSYE